MIYLLCCLRPRVHMELRKGRKRTLKVREMAEVEENGACEYLVGPRKQTVAKGQMSRVRKGL